MFKRYSLIKTLTQNFNILSNADANANADADAGVIAIALPVLSYRRAKKYILTIISLQIYSTDFLRLLSGLLVEHLTPNCKLESGLETYQSEIVSLSKTPHSTCIPRKQYNCCEKQTNLNPFKFFYLPLVCIFSILTLNFSMLWGFLVCRTIGNLLRLLCSAPSDILN